jgi:hypothetical protein
MKTKNQLNDKLATLKSVCKGNNVWKFWFDNDHSTRMEFDPKTNTAKYYLNDDPKFLDYVSTVDELIKAQVTFAEWVEEFK